MANQVWDAYGVWMGMDLGMDLASPSFGRNFGLDIRLHGITGTTNGETYKKKGLTGYGFIGRTHGYVHFFVLGTVPMRIP